MKTRSGRQLPVLTAQRKAKPGPSGDAMVGSEAALALSILGLALFYTFEVTCDCSSCCGSALTKGRMTHLAGPMQETVPGKWCHRPGPQGEHSPRRGQEDVCL